jgi:hypothetical protein
MNRNSYVVATGRIASDTRGSVQPKKAKESSSLSITREGAFSPKGDVMGTLFKMAKLGTKMTYRAFKPRTKKKYPKESWHISSKKYSVKRSTINKNKSLWL